jgi:hypothetical protein
MTPEVQKAVNELKATFSDNAVQVDEDADGGAYVVVNDLAVGDQYQPPRSWCGFAITFQYPHADVYPHFLDGSLKRNDGDPLGASFSGVTDWRGRSAIQVSRRSNHINPAVDTAAAKLLKVLEWVRSR